MSGHLEGYKIISEIAQFVRPKVDDSQENGIGIRNYYIEIHFLGTDGKVKTRNFRIYVPITGDKTRHPLIVNVHYPIELFSSLSCEHLRRGWALLSPENCPNDIGFPIGRSGLAGDDLRYNMAMLDMVRRQNYIDANRIALKGGSAGGYQMLMLSITHFGIVCGYDLSGIANLAYEYKYIMKNNRLNNEYKKNPENFKLLSMMGTSSPYVRSDIEHQLPKDQDSEFNDYPLPRIKVAGIDHFVPSIIGTLDADNPESERWHEFSPVCHIDRICHPLLVSHSTADVIVPIYQVTDKNAYKNIETNFPKGYQYHLYDLMISEKLNKPLDELYPAVEVETFLLNPYKSDYDNRLHFSPSKRININIIEEWMPERTFGHFRDSTKVDVSDTDFIEFYFEKNASITNKLTPSKLDGLACRYIGKLQLLQDENEFKVNQSPEIFGSLYSDRLDVLLNLAAFLGIDVWEESDHIYQNTIQVFSGYSSKNLNYLVDAYANLKADLKFMDIDSALSGKNFLLEPIKCILNAISFYAGICGEIELSILSSNLLKKI